MCKVSLELFIRHRTEVLVIGFDPCLEYLLGRNKRVQDKRVFLEDHQFELCWHDLALAEDEEDVGEFEQQVVAEWKHKSLKLLVSQVDVLGFEGLGNVVLNGVVHVLFLHVLRLQTHLCQLDNLTHELERLLSVDD